MYHTALSASSDESAQAIPRVVIKLVAFLAISTIAALNAFSLKLGARANIALTLLKVLALLAVLLMGLVQLGRGKASDSLRSNLFEGSSTSPGRYALALYSGLWAFDGWDNARYASVWNVARLLDSPAGFSQFCCWRDEERCTRPPSDHTHLNAIGYRPFPCDQHL